jgi:DNA mismatch repair protein MutL
MLYVFANGRRIQDYSLMMAMEYGTQGWFPNGTHPIGAVYIDIDPALADFNIHPAKREVRFRDPGAIHHAITTGLRDFCRRFNLKAGTQTEHYAPQAAAQASAHASAYAGEMFAMEALLNRSSAPEQSPGFSPHTNNVNKIYDIDSLKAVVSSADITAEKSPVYGEPKYAGKAFDLFIMAEWGDKLFIIDQHAAHERILYNRFLSEPIPKQELLIPLFFTTESEEDDTFLESKQGELAALSIVIEKDGDGWRVDALPEGWHLGDAETVQEILKLRKAAENIAERWAATLSCHRAIRDGEQIDNATALALAKEALALPDPHCPHGRPIWTEISREALCRAVRRT